MLGAAEVYAASNQATIITPFILAGAMAPVTVAGVRPRRSPRRWPGSPSPNWSVRALRWCSVVRQLDVDADRGADVRNSRAGAGAVHARRLARRLAGRSAAEARSARRSCPTPRRPTRARRHDADDHGRRQLRAPRRRMAGGRAGDRLREVHPRRGPAGDDGGVRQGVDLSENGQALDAIRENPPGNTSSVRRTRWPTSSTPSTAARPPTTPASSNGPRTARSTPPSGPTGSGSSASPTTSRRRSTPAVDEELQDYVARARPSCPTSSPDLLGAAAWRGLAASGGWPCTPRDIQWANSVVGESCGQKSGASHGSVGPVVVRGEHVALEAGVSVPTPTGKLMSRPIWPPLACDADPRANFGARCTTSVQTAARFRLGGKSRHRALGGPPASRACNQDAASGRPTETKSARSAHQCC